MKTVLIVDDSKIMRNIVKGTFDRITRPANFLEAEDGKKAVQVLLSNPVDLILLDWNMPNLSGIDFLRKIRTLEKYKSIPIIMVTSEASKLSVIEAVREGATAYITKPFTEKIFIEKLAQISF
jgi:two-component system chemotaxis response regulator CheY